MLSVLFVLMLVVLGGIIAYFADRLGRTLGKKRLSLFGLRPRHTAEVLTVFAGAIIPIITFAIMMAASADVREWILHSPQWKADRDQALSDLHGAQAELVHVQADLKKQQSSMKTIDTRMQELKVREASLMSEVSAKTSQARKAEGQYKKAFAQYKTVNGELVVVRKDYMQVRKDYAQVQTGYKKLNGDYTALNSNFSGLKIQHQALQSSFENLRVLRDQADREVTADRNKLDDLGKQLQAEQGQLNQTRKDYEAVQQDLESAKAELNKTQVMLENLKTQYSWSDAANQVSRLNPEVYERGDEVTRMMMPAGLTEAQAKAAVDSLLRKASDVAIAHKANPNSSHQAAGLVSYNEELTAQKQYDAVVKSLTAAQEPSALVASSFYNTFEGEFVPVVINVYNNPLVYHRMQPIAETLVQGALADAQIFQEISDFVRSKVQARAREAKMIPVAGKEESFGQVGAGDILKLVSQIKGVGRPVRLVALAKQDTHAADSLDLTFQLRL